MAALERWGLLERLEATGCPPVETYSFDFGPLTISGSPRPIDGIAHGYCPRRTVLDKLLVDAAVEAGAELREGFTVDEVLAADGDGDGHPRARARARAAVTEHAPVVIGADGRHSAGGQDGPARAVRRAAVAPGDVLRLLERPARRGLRHHDPGRAPPGLGGHPDPRRPHRRPVRLAGRGVPGEPLRTSRGTSSRPSSTPPSSPSACARATARVEVRRLGRAARVLPQAVRPGLGAASATPATTRTRSRRWASTTPSATPSCWPAPWTTRSPGGARTRTRWPTTSRRATTRRCRSTSSPTSSRSSSPRRPRCSSCSGRCTATRRRWTSSSASRRPRSPAPEFFAPENVGRIMAQAGTAG